MQFITVTIISALLASAFAALSCNTLDCRACDAAHGHPHQLVTAYTNIRSQSVLQL